MTAATLGLAFFLRYVFFNKEHQVDQVRLRSSGVLFRMR